MQLSNQQESQWYVLNFVKKLGRPSPKALIDSYNREGHHLELFAPIIRPARIVNGKVRYAEKLLTFYYVFVKGTFDEVKELCIRPGNEFSLLLDRGSTRKYAILSDEAMDNFKIIARAHTNAIDFYNIDDIELANGDIVEVVGGNYNGLRGTFLPRSRSNKGTLVIAAAASLGAIVWEIDSKLVRILEFAPDTRRLYDLVDSFIPKLYPILRKFHNEEPLTDKEKSQLAVFNRRMCAVTPSNQKAEAKLLAVLICVQTILADMPALAASQQRFEKRKPMITNAWTRALTELLIAVAQNDTARLKASYATIAPLSTSKLTASQALLLAEYRHYLPQ
ncbi:MAG: hypothetical protein NC343_05425 [Muribaculum sp.]|nr:hypothetical protein [Muribaculaceae bacterium]MCM1081171.1 hypothetical protein [Muribaculum sp.]